jgi:proteasome alpha subunit
MEMPSEIQHQAMGYDRTATMFSPDGHLLQVEYAEKTVRLGVASIGMKCSDGVFIIADRRINDKLIVPESASRVHEVDEHIIASAAGITSDARVLIDKVRLVAQQHRVTYDSPIDTESIIREIANTKQMFTQYGGARPYGVSTIIAGVDEDGAQVFSSDVTGNYFAYKTIAIGEHDEKIKEALRLKYNDKLNIEKGIKLALEIFKEILGKNFEFSRFDFAIVRNDSKKIERPDENFLKSIK